MRTVEDEQQFYDLANRMAGLLAISLMPPDVPPAGALSFHCLTLIAACRRHPEWTQAIGALVERTFEDMSEHLDRNINAMVRAMSVEATS